MRRKKFFDRKALSDASHHESCKKKVSREDDVASQASAPMYISGSAEPEVVDRSRSAGWRPSIMGVGNRFVSAAVIMQINTAGNLFKYRNKRSSRRRRRSRSCNLRFGAPGMCRCSLLLGVSEPFCPFYIAPSRRCRRWKF
ncbi:jg27241 [Pararge aegeria aegeria]|uniref:Jg27241 protein n=1 Tax=Pararge aegeria aegeria TaxID=348720 RepID=A0A8S4RSL8_9NEOP|nr:jg27241 [Pararge aegeria aegeria]